MAAGGVLVGRGYVSIRPEFEGDWSRQASSRASSAGKSAGSSFGKAFGAGMKGIGVLAGVAVAANLQNVVAASAVLAPALATAGAAAGALKLGLSGVGDAMKAAFADGAADAKAAASATRAVESAQRGLANAQRALADARVQAAERVRDAQREVRDAERDLSDAQRDARDVQGELNDARREASRALEDMNQRLAESQLDEREAVLRLKQAEEELKAAQRKPGTDPADLARLQLAYDRAALNLQEQRRDTKRLADDTKKANKAGVEGSQQVLAVKERIAQANRTVADRERALADAQAGVDKARRDGARSVADAQRAVAEAAAALADAQAAAAAQTSKLDQAMAKLSPNARSFVNAIRGIAPAWTAMRMSVQDELFRNLDTDVAGLASTTIPILQTRLSETAQIWNAISRNAIAAVQDMARSGMLNQILAGANRNFSAFEQVPARLVTAFGQLSVAAQPAMEQLSVGFAAAITRATERLSASFESGGLQTAISTAFEILGQFAGLIGNILGALGQIFRAASDAGGSLVASLSAGFAELGRVLALPEVQAQLRALFGSVAQIVGAILPVVSALVQAALPLLVQLGAAVSAVAVQLGPVLTEFVTAWGAALMPLMQAVLPIVQEVAVAALGVVRAFLPLLGPIGELAAIIVASLQPALTPLLKMAVDLAGVLAGPLAVAIGALTPIFELIGSVIARLATAIQPFLGQIVNLVGQVAGLLVGIFSVALEAALTAMEPILEIGIKLIEQVFSALQPLLPTITVAVGALAEAALALLGPITEIWASMANQLAPILGQLGPILAELARIVLAGLAAALPILTETVMILFTAFQPIFPLVTEIAGIFLELGASVLKELLPPLLQLVQAAIDLVVAFLPILPPLASLIGLVVQLATSILSWLLPPLAEFAAFLIRNLAGALGTVIGWIAGLVSGIASLVMWVTDKLGPAFRWLNDTIIQPIWRTIREAVRFAWEYVIRPIWERMNNWIKNTLAPAFIDLQRRVSYAWEIIRRAISNVWEKWIKPAFEHMRDMVGLVAASFRLAKDAIGKEWAKIKELTRGPIKWVIDIVYNKGVVALWNSAASVLPLDKLKPMKFAEGGSVLGPGTGTSDSIPAWLSNGEHVWTAKEVRGAGGHGAVEALRRQAAGNRFAKGGPVGAHGGVGDWFGGTLKKVTGALGSATDWILGGVYKAAQLAAKPIRSLINAIPGTDNGWGALAKALPTALLNQSLSSIKGREDREVAAGGQWLKPVDVPYGTRFGVTGRMWSSGQHTGLDFPARTGTPVHAVAPGQILGVGRKGPYGNHILIQHGDGLQSLYAHLSSAVRNQGAVSPGQLIGRVGATGNVTGPHLHLEARLNGRPVDPLPYLMAAAPTSGGSGVIRWTGVVQQALRMLGQPLSHTSTTLRRMNQESGGNPNIVNRWDSNWAAGTPSVGLMQVIGPTFRAYAGALRGRGPFSYGVSVNPLANIYASMRYALARYGSLPRAYNRPGGYDSGGWLGPGQVGVNHLRQPEAVLTPGQWRSMSTLAASGVASLDGQRLRLVVRDREFDAFLEEIADGRVAATLQPAVTAMRANRRG